jgi:hypothetical protein
MFFLFRFGFCFGFAGGSIVCAGSLAKAECPPKTRHDGAVFFSLSAVL